jgi:hypothetical protein
MSQARKMDIVRVNSDELEEYHIEDFIDKFVYNHLNV